MTPKERLRIFRQEQQGKQPRTAEERRRIFYEEQAATYQQPPVKERSAIDALGGGLAQAGGDLAQSALSLTEAAGSAAGGDFRPLGQMAESAVRGATNLAGYVTAGARPDPEIAELQRQRNERQTQTPAGRYVQRRNAQLAAEAERDTSRTNKVARGVGRVAGTIAPALATGVLTGGSIPAMAATGAFQSAGQPENIVASTVVGALPVPLGQAAKAGVNAIRRVFGKGAAQIIEAEAVPIQQAAAEAISPPVGAATPTIQRAMQQFDEAVQRISASNLTPAQKAQELEAAIATIGREASGAPPLIPGESMVQSRYPRGMQAPPMRMPGEPLGSVTGFEPIPGTPAARTTPQAATATTDPLIERAKRELASVGIDLASDRQGIAIIQRRLKVPYAQAVRIREQIRAEAMEAPATMPRISPETGPPALEADLSTPSFGVKAANDLAYTETAGPSAQAPLNLDAAIADAAESVPRSLAQKIKDELLGAMGASKSLRSSIDISAPFRQGSLLMLPPTKWKQAGRAWADMFRAFKGKNFDAINDAIAGHPKAGRMKEAGLFLANRTGEGLNRGEEAFLRRSGSKISETVSKLPGVKQSDQMYTTFLDSQRVQRFDEYTNIIDRSGLSPEQVKVAEKAAAKWINIMSGRGSLGERLDRAFEGLNFFLFSPRYVASRLNVLNPVMYAKNAATPGGRVILKEQMKELTQYAAVVAATLYAAKSAGADVNLDRKSSDFLKVKIGNRRYDMLAGLQQVMRLYFRVGEDLARAGRGEKPKVGQTATDITETFLSYKLSPPAAVFRDFINQRTPDRKPFTAGRAARDLVAPMQWADFVDSFQKEGLGGVGMSGPGIVGIGSELHDPDPVQDAVERVQPLFTELKRLDKKVSDLRRKAKSEFKNGKYTYVDDESDAQFNARVQQFGQNYALYGLQLVDSQRFKQAPDSVKVLALDALNERAKKLTLQEMALPELELDADTLMDSAQGSKKNPANTTPGRY